MFIGKWEVFIIGMFFIFVGIADILSQQGLLYTVGGLVEIIAGAGFLLRLYWFRGK